MIYTINHQSGIQSVSQSVSQLVSQSVSRCHMVMSWRATNLFTILWQECLFSCAFFKKQQRFDERVWLSDHTKCINNRCRKVFASVDLLPLQPTTNSQSHQPPPISVSISRAEILAHLECRHASSYSIVRHGVRDP
jgi:hypothetical protein